VVELVTYQYGPDILVSAIWEKNKRSVEVYLRRARVAGRVERGEGL